MRRLLLAVAAVGSAVAGCAIPETGFDIEHISTRATLNEDASMEVVEEVTYDFNDDFSVGTRSFELDFGSTYEITDIQAFQDGEPLDTVTDTPTLFEWNLDPDGETVTGRQTYEVRYTVRGAAVVHPDVADLNWQWIGTTSPEVERLDVRIEVPGQGEGVRFFGHGPLNGVIDREGNEIVLGVDDVPANQFVESRILVPAERFTVEPTPPRVEDQILAEEERLAELANQEREEAEEQEELERQARLFFNIVTPFVIAAGWLIFFLVWRRWGKEPPSPPDIGDYWREVPDDPPAVAVALTEWGNVTPTAFAATLVDLAQRGYLTITEQPGEGGLFGRKAEYRFDWKGKEPAGLLPFEQDLLDTLFHGQQTTTQEAFTSWARANQSQSAKFWSRFQSQVKGELRRRQYISRGRGAPYAIHIVTAVLVGLWGLAAFAVGAVLVGGLCMGSAIGLLVVTPLLRQRTDVGGRRFAEWNGLKRFLQDFSRLDEAVSGDMVIYERYLVAAVALGVSDQLIEGLRVKVPQVVEQPGFAPWYVGHSAVGVGGIGGRMGSMASIGAFADTFGSSSTTAFTPRSSGSGFSGGGFSGGGGGGGGGGGFGAR